MCGWDGGCVCAAVGWLTSSRIFGKHSQLYNESIILLLFSKYT